MTAGTSFRDAEVLLVYPPEVNSFHPYASIPTLAGYLRESGVAVAGYDANQAFLRNLLDSRNIAAGLEFTKERFLQLNAKGQLAFSEMVEYFKLVSVLQALGEVEGEIDWLGLPFVGPEELQQASMAAKNVGLRLAIAPHFPQLTLNEDKAFGGGDLSPYSTDEILASLQQRSFRRSLYPDLDTAIGVAPSLRLVGFSVVFAGQMIPAFQMAAEIARKRPGIHVTFGGPFVSIYCRHLTDTRLFRVIDSLVLDEGELPLARLNAELAGGAPDLSRVPGLVYAQDGRVLANPPAAPLDLESTPLADYTVLPLDGYLVPKEHVIAPIRLSRGCYWRRCAFCRTDLFSTSHYQQPDPEYVSRQLKTIIHEAGLRNLAFSDESARPDVIEHVSRRFVEDPEMSGVKWWAHTRVADALTPARCALYARAGCQLIWLGIESLDDRVLGRMRKGTSVDLINRVLARAAGILPLGAYMMIGFPGETLEEARGGYSRVKALKEQGLVHEFYYSLFHLVSGSPIAASPGDYGVSGICHDPRLDLSADVLTFDAPGMSRSEALLLYGQIAAERQFPGDGGLQPRKLVLDGRTVDLRYDLRDVFNRLYSGLDASAASDVERLSRGDQTVPPLRAKVSGMEARDGR